MSPKTLVIRADASVAMGSGHVMRCLALAQEWQVTGGQALFVMAECTPGIERRIEAEGFEIRRLSQTPDATAEARSLCRLAETERATWVVLDGYQFSETYQDVVCDSGLKLLVVDDNADFSHSRANVIVNQNLHATPNLYDGKLRETRLLLGASYVLLRREFLAWKRHPRQFGAVGKNILVMMGGSDPENTGERVLRVLAKMDRIGQRIKILLGSSNPHTAHILNTVRSLAINVDVLRDSSNMAELMEWADLAVSAAGSTSWEMCFMGLPAVLIDIAANQTRVAEEMNRRGLAIHVGMDGLATEKPIIKAVSDLVESVSLRAEISRRGEELVDGRGSERVLRMLAVCSLTLRRAQANDCELLWRWANDPEVRRASFHREQISWSEHDQWFEKKLHDPDCRIFMAMNDGAEVGQVRLEKSSDEEAVISISIAPEHRGRGYAPGIIHQAVDMAVREWGCSQVHAYIRRDNPASQWAFAAADFREKDSVTINGEFAHHFVRDRDRTAE